MKKKKIQLSIQPQYVQLTEHKEQFMSRGSTFEAHMHYSQWVIRDHFETLPLFTFLIAPTATGKSYCFAFPALSGTEWTRKKGLLVLPTNPLIDELYENFSATFQNLKIAKLTGVAMDEADKRGSYQRWEYCRKVVEENDIIITNPDILNYAMHGGYDTNMRKRFGNKLAGGQSIITFLQNLDYIVYDEFHLYDEEQIANIMTMVKLREMFVKDSARILFVSATPELRLLDLLQAEDVTERSVSEGIALGKQLSQKHYTILEEKITQEGGNARKIRGEILIDWVCDESFLSIILSYQKEIKQRIGKGEKVLLIFNSLAELNKTRQALSEVFGEDSIQLINGYHKKANKNAPLILATSKVEVGANLGVDFGIMQTGFNSRSCIQRFGRYARNGVSGKVIIALDLSQHHKKGSGRTLFNKFEKGLKGKGIDPEKRFSMAYPDFIEVLKGVLDDPKFYIEKVPLLYGEYLFAIGQNFLKNNKFDAVEIFQQYARPEVLPEKSLSRYKYFQSINYKIHELKQLFKEATEWEKWWNDYLETYLAFRGAMPSVKVIDLEEGGIETEYSLEWLLVHKDIVSREQDERGRTKLTVDGMREERNKDLQYEIVTMPHRGTSHHRFLDYKERLKPAKAFSERLKSMIKKVDMTPFALSQKALCEQLLGLSKTFSEKRFKVKDIQADDRSLLDAPASRETI